MKYIIKTEKENRVLLSNCDKECESCFGKLSTNKSRSTRKFCNKIKAEVRCGFKSENDYIILLCVTGNEAKSKRYFNFNFNNIISIYTEFESNLSKQEENWTRKFNTLIHNITTLNKKASDSLYLMLDGDELRKSDDKVQYVMNKLNINKSTASSLLKYRKANYLINNEIVVERILREGIREKRPAKHVLYKLIQMAFGYFWDDFHENTITIDFSSSHSDVYVDFDSIMPALIHLVGNMAKYVQPSSEIKILYEDQENYLTVHIEMNSICIYKDEEEEIYKDGYSGKEAKKLGKIGTGIGIYAVKKLFNLNDSTFELIRGNYTWYLGGICYSNNVAKLCFPKESLYIKEGINKRIL